MSDEIRYAKVLWSVDDVISLRPEMTPEVAEKFLVENEKYIQDAMVQAGWAAIEALLPETCRYCGGGCPKNGGEFVCDGYAGDIDNLYDGAN